MKKNLLITAIMLSLLSSCKNEKSDDIRVIPLTLDMEKIPFLSESKYNLSYELIPIETNDSTLFDTFDRLKAYDSILVTINRDQRGVNIFNRNGKHIAKIPVGRGPEEILNPVDVVIDEKRKTIEVYDYLLRKISIYDFEGSFVGTFQEINSPMNMEFAKIGDTRIFYNCGFSSGKEYPKLFSIITDDDGIITTDYFMPRIIESNHAHGSFGFFTRYNDTLFFNAFHNGIIYGITESEPTPFPVYKIENVYSESKTDFPTLEDFLEYCQNKGYAEGLSNLRVLDYGNLWAFSIDLSTKFYQLFWDKIENKLYKSIFSYSSGWTYMNAIYFSDGLYSYHQFDPSAAPSIDREKIDPATYPLHDLIMERYNKYGDEENPYIILIKYEKSK